MPVEENTIAAALAATTTIECGGFTDQTCDTWSVKDASAYTGGFWLACRAAAIEMTRGLDANEMPRVAANGVTMEKSS